MSTEGATTWAPWVIASKGREQGEGRGDDVEHGRGIGTHVHGETGVGVVCVCLPAVQNPQHTYGWPRIPRTRSLYGVRIGGE